MIVCAACGYDPDLPIKLVASIKIAGSYPSQNQLGANARGMAGFKYRKFRQDFASELHAALSRYEVPKATGWRRVWIKRVYRPGKRVYDTANLLGGGKALVDVLVNLGLLLDDSAKYFEGIYQQEPGPHDAIHLDFYETL